MSFEAAGVFINQGEATETYTLSVDGFAKNDFAAAVVPIVGNITLNLPPASHVVGSEFIVKHFGGAGFALVSPQTGETIDKGGAQLLSTIYDTIMVVSDGDEWWITGRH